MLAYAHPSFCPTCSSLLILGIPEVAHVCAFLADKVVKLSRGAYDLKNGKVQNSKTEYERVDLLWCLGHLPDYYRTPGA